MKAGLSTLILAMLATITWLVVDRSASKSQASSTTPQPRLHTDKLKTDKLRTPHLITTLIDPSLHLADQIEAIRSLPTDLTPEELQALIDLLYQHPGTMNAATWSTIQNEIMEVLRQPRFHHLTEYPKALATLLGDKNADPIMRDYAAQHLSLLISDMANFSPSGTQPSRAPSNPSGAQDQSPVTNHQSLVTPLIDILTGDREIHHQVVGTTLMSLCDLHQKHPQLLENHRPQLSQAILHLLAADTPATLSNKISAIQSAGRMNIQEALPAIRQMARNPSTADLQRPTSNSSPTLRLNAIASLGYYADPEDRPLLEQIATGNTRLRFAAQTALKNYDN